jgi:VIT1/CCC1 family predicted Fe2+/Mn2+ transporter
MLGTILIVVLILFLIGALPTWSHSQNWGYAPSGLVGTILIVVLILYLLGRL